MTRCRWPGPERLAVLAFVAWACAAAAQPRQEPAPAALPCESVVIVRCERPAADDPARRIDARRRAATDPLELERIIIEADPIRRSLDEALAPPFVDHPPGSTYTFATAEGGQCTCMNRCPPIPFPCCQCSAPTNRYGTSPGASPLR